MFTEINKRGLSCIEHLANIARTLGLEFFKGTPPQILMEIVALFPQTVIHPVLDSNTIYICDGGGVVKLGNKGRSRYMDWAWIWGVY